MALCVLTGRKSCAITTALRLGQFLGNERIKDKGLACKYIVARQPEGRPTSERAIPVLIFSAEPAIKRSYLRQWCGTLPRGALQAGPHHRGSRAHHAGRKLTLWCSSGADH